MPRPLQRPMQRRLTRLAALGAAASALATTAARAMSQTTPTAARTVVTRADQLPRRSCTLPALPSELLDNAASEPADPGSAARHRSAGRPGRLRHPRCRHAARVAVGTACRSRCCGSTQPRCRSSARRSARCRTSPACASRRACWPSLRFRPARNLQPTVKPGCRRRWRSATAPCPGPTCRTCSSRPRVSSSWPAPPSSSGSVRAAMDPAAQNAGMQIDARSLAALIGARAQIEQVLPLRQAVVAGLASVIDRQAATAPPKPDLWTPRLVTLPADAKLQPGAHGDLGFGRGSRVVQGAARTRHGLHRHRASLRATCCARSARPPRAGRRCAATPRARWTCAPRSTPPRRASSRSRSQRSSRSR